MPERAPPLMLLAEDEIDLQLFSAFLQDAITQVSEMAWLPSLNRFVFAVGRFRWEAEGKDPGLVGRVVHERVRTGIHFDTVVSVRKRNLPTFDVVAGSSEDFLSLLALESEVLDNGNVAITLIFSGDGAVRIEAECVSGHMQDLDLAWKTLRRPEHAVELPDDEADEA